MQREISNTHCIVVYLMKWFVIIRAERSWFELLRLYHRRHDITFGEASFTVWMSNKRHYGKQATAAGVTYNGGPSMRK